MLGQRQGYVELGAQYLETLLQPTAPAVNLARASANDITP
jgi:hypothetical protein